MPAPVRPEPPPLWHSKHTVNRIGPLQKARIRGPVREMAGFTTVDANRGVLEQKWSAFVGMALETRLLI